MHSPEWVIVGRLRKSHGLRGEIIVEPITDAPAEVFSTGRVLFAGDAAGDPLPDPPELTEPPAPVLPPDPFVPPRALLPPCPLPDSVVLEVPQDANIVSKPTQHGAR